MILRTGITIHTTCTFWPPRSILSGAGMRALVGEQALLAPHLERLSQLFVRRPAHLRRLSGVPRLSLVPRPTPAQACPCEVMWRRKGHLSLHAGMHDWGELLLSPSGGELKLFSHAGQPIHETDARAACGPVTGNCALRCPLSGVCTQGTY